jgi:hypothetical protein
MLLHKANRGRAAGAVLALSLLGAGEAAAGPQGPPGTPPGGAIEVETIGGRLTLPLAGAAGLAIAPEAPRPELVLDGTRRLPVDEVLSIRFPALEGAGAATDGTPARFVLFLRSGAELAGTVAGGDGDAVRFRAPRLGDKPFAFPLEAVRGLVVETAPPSAAGGAAAARREAAVRQRIRSRIAREKPEKDAILLLQGGRVDGVLEKFEEDGVRFSSDTLGDVKVTYEKVRGIALAALAGESPPAAGQPAAGAPEARVTLRDGTRFAAAVTGLASGRLSVREPALGALSVPLDAVLDLVFLNGRSVYLSDREPARVVERLGPAFRKSMPHQKDENVLGEPLRMGGREHARGLGVHSYSLLEYDLGGRFARFQAVIGLDESARPAEGDSGLADVAEVVFRVRLDGKLLLEKKMSWRDPPAAIDVPLRSAEPAGASGKLLSLEVDYGAPEGGFNFALDRANWADARVVR